MLLYCLTNRGGVLETLPFCSSALKEKISWDSPLLHAIPRLVGRVHFCLPLKRSPECSSSVYLVEKGYWGHSKFFSKETSKDTPLLHVFLGKLVGTLFCLPLLRRLLDAPLLHT